MLACGHPIFSFRDRADADEPRARGDDAGFVARFDKNYHDRRDDRHADAGPADGDYRARSGPARG